MWNVHICYKFYTETSWQDTWNLPRLESPHLEHLSLPVWAHLGSKLLLVGWHLLLVTCILLLTGWSWLETLFLPVLAWWEVCALMSHQIDLGCLLGHLQLVWCDVLLPFEASIFFKSWLTLLTGNFSRFMLLSLMVFRHELFILQDEPKDVMMQDICSFLWVFGKRTCACTALYHSSTDLLPWQKLVSRLNPALTSFTWGLQKSSYLVQFFSEQATGNILIHPKITTPSYNCFAFLWLRKLCKLAI